MNPLAIEKFILRWVSMIVYGQMIIVSALFVMTIVLLTIRKRRQLRFAHLLDRYADDLTTELLNAPEKDSDKIARPGIFKSLERTALREACHRQIKFLSGPERVYIIRRYIDFGFAKDNVDECYSNQWWKRLKAVVQLSHLQMPMLIPLFQDLSKDSNDLVCAYAYLGLSRLKEGSECVDAQALLRLAHTGRINLLREIITNLCRHREPTQMISMALSSKNENLQEAMISSLALMKTPEIGTELAEVLRHPQHLSNSLLVNVLRALKEIGDPSFLDAVLNFKNHGDERVQLEVVEFILSYAADADEELKAFNPAELSIPVQRALQKYRTRIAA